MSKLRQKQRAKTVKPARVGWQEFIRIHPHLAKRMECGMPGQMLYSVAVWMKTSRHSADTHRAFADTVLPDLEPATVEAFSGLPHLRAEQCLHIMARACDHAWEGKALHKPAPQVLIACLLWLDCIERSGFLVPEEGSAFDRARKAFNAELDAGSRSEEYAADYVKAKDAAFEIAADMQIRFEEIGLFVGALDTLFPEPQAEQVAA